LGAEDGRDQHFIDRGIAHFGAGWQHLHADWRAVSGVGALLDRQGAEISPANLVADTVKQIVRQADRCEGIDDRTFDAHHHVDPFANTAIGLEQFRVGQIVAADISDLLVADENLAVISQIGPSKEGREQIDSQGADDLYARLSQPFRPMRPEEGFGAEIIRQDLADHTPLRGAFDGSQHIADAACGVEDVEFEADTV
jgi:hypothetical protein